MNRGSVTCGMQAADLSVDIHAEHGARLDGGDGGPQPQLLLGQAARSDSLEEADWRGLSWLGS